MNAPDDNNMSLLDALEFAQNLLNTGELYNAEKIYRQLFKAVPEHAEITHMFGLVLMHTNRVEEASVLMEKSLQINPIYLDAHINLAHAYVKLEFYDRAEQFYRSAIRIDPDSTNALCSLGNLLKRTGNIDDAIDCYRKTIELDASSYTANTNLSLLLHQQERYDEARAISKAWLNHTPDNESAKLLHASLSGDNVPDRASDAYIRDMFDQSATEFDTHLSLLDYQAPTLVKELVKEYYPTPHALTILDAGCGTGLCGPHLRDVAKQLTGIDLSTKMLKIAEQRQCYDSLENAELSEYLGRATGHFDLILCMDTFCYFGPLDEVMQLSANALSYGGRIIFSLEVLDNKDLNYSLHPGQRYNHTTSYTKAVLDRCGLTIQQFSTEIMRKEGSKSVKELLVVAQKSHTL